MELFLETKFFYKGASINYTLRPRKLRSNFCFIKDFPLSLHKFNLASCILLVVVTVYFPKVPQLAWFMCSCHYMDILIPISPFKSAILLSEL